MMTRKKRLKQISSDLDLIAVNPCVEDALISGISIDSRKSVKGDLFIAIPSEHVLKYLQDAYQKGVRHFILDKENDGLISHLPLDIDVYLSNHIRKDAALLAHNFYNEKPEIIAYITGTNGKSSTVSLLRQLWQLNGIEAASIGTLGVERSFGFDKSLDIPSLTSLDPISFNKTLSTLKGERIKAVACEASSHGLHQFRLDGPSISVAGFTNLTQDHLDYHKTMDAYFNAKAELFNRILEPLKPAILNVDSPYFETLKKIADTRSQKVITYGNSSLADFRIIDYKIDNNFFKLDLDFMGTVSKNISFPLFGVFQLENLLCASSMAFATGVSISDIIRSIPLLRSISGRMEYIGKSKEGGLVFVDYAHTPDALENILKGARHHNPKSLHLVFGCGGNRDITKRPLMGAIANQLADTIYVTNDNPRFEDDAMIRQQIIETCPKAIEIGDRSKAIETAILNLKQNDILIIAGKGHEEGQIIKDVVHPFSDQTEARKWMI